MSKETENRVLAALMIYGRPDNIYVQEAMLNLHEDYFYNVHLKNIFNLIRKLFISGNNFNGLIVNELVDACDHPDCCHLVSSYVSANSLFEDVKKLKQINTRNLISSRMRQLSFDFQHEIIDEDACNLIFDGCHEISKIGIDDGKHVFTAEILTDKFLLEESKTNKIIPSGLTTIDTLNGGGFKEGSLITIAGRSGMGKTSFGVHLARNLASNHHAKHVLFYSLEMVPDEIVEKQVTCILRKHPIGLSKNEKNQAALELMKVPFTVNFKPLASIDYIETTSRITHIKNPISVIVVDYLGLVQNKSKLETHVLKQADISLRLAALALELNCIVVALTQVNRDYSSRDDKCPITSDSADSSGSERSSGYWLGIYRPEIDYNDEGYLNQFIVKCRKNRFGKVWKAVFSFDDAIFNEMDQRLYYEPTIKKRGIDSFVSNVQSTSYKRKSSGDMPYE